MKYYGETPKYKTYSRAAMIKGAFMKGIYEAPST